MIPFPRRRLTAAGLAVGVALAAGGSAPADRSSSATTRPAGRAGATARSGSADLPHRASAARLLDWPEFGLDAQRSGTSGLSTGITATNVGHLRHVSVALPGTVDSSPIYLHAVSVAAASRDVVVVTTTYGKTLAIDAGGGRILWMFTPAGYSRWAGSYQITTASPLADPDHRFVYAASPDGLIHKLALADGAEITVGHWPVRVTRDATHEKLAAALNLDGRYVLAATGGYIGDARPYQGHLLAIDRASGKVASIFNTLCANRRRLIAPPSCPASDSAILSRGGAIVEPGDKRLLIDTGNGPWNGRTNFGDSVVELTAPSLRLRQAFTPVEERQLNESDTDLGSSAPALLGHGRALVAGKDGSMRVLALARLDGRRPEIPNRLGGEAQRLALPGGGMLFTQPAVWRHGGHTTVFVADEHATAAYALRSGRLRLLWQANGAGTSPVMAGGLLYVYEPDGGGVLVYEPSSPRPIARLAGQPGHWNSPIVVDGHVIEPEGDANEHRLSGTLDIFTAP